jgi:uncharacterized membrane protein YeaQ/YmgE (transglycosylase-associated protein family)
LYLCEFTGAGWLTRRLLRKTQMKETTCRKVIRGFVKEKCMYVLSWIIIGLVAGWSAGKILKGNTYGPFMDIAMGICGAVAGGMLMRSAGFAGYGGTIITTVVALIGAVLLTLLAGFVSGRRMYARQL